MDSVATMAARDRSDLFAAAAEAKGVSTAIIEKDFWVCWVLRHLYTLRLPAAIWFKGGTSLSKVFGVIDRMSEDIDLVIDRAALGFTGDRDPGASTISGNERERLIDALKAAAAEFVDTELLPALRARFGDVLGDVTSWTLSADITNPDNATIAFRYPSDQKAEPYLRPVVLLEIGARGDTWPGVVGTIRPYVADHFPRFVPDSDSTVRAITGGRTFWEKATYLHALAHRTAEKAASERPARHYYDLFRLLQHAIGQDAIEDLGLLTAVTRHKMAFYRQPAARYELAIPGSFRLVPDPRTAIAIRPDYDRMAEVMIFGEAPDFVEVLHQLRQAETRINAMETGGRRVDHIPRPPG